MGTEINGTATGKGQSHNVDFEYHTGVTKVTDAQRYALLFLSIAGLASFITAMITLHMGTPSWIPISCAGACGGTVIAEAIGGVAMHTWHSKIKKQMEKAKDRIEMGFESIQLENWVSKENNFTMNFTHTSVNGFECITVNKLGDITTHVFKNKAEGTEFITRLKNLSQYQGPDWLS